MKYLFTKFRRDLSKMWVQFFAVFMMSVLAITIYAGMEGVWYGLQRQTQEYQFGGCMGKRNKYNRRYD